MGRKATSELEKVTTQRGEDFLANPNLKAGLDALSDLVKTTLPEHSDFPMGTIRDAARMASVMEYETWHNAEMERTRKEIERLQRQIEETKKA